MTNSRSEARSLAVRVLHDYRRRDGLTCYANDSNRQRDERNMIAAFEEIVAPHLAFTEPAAAMPGVPEREVIARQLYAWSPCVIEESIGCDGPGSCILATWDQVADVVRDKFLDRADVILKLSPSHSGETGEAERILRKAIAWEEEQAVASGIGKKAAACHSYAAMALEAACRDVARAALTPNDGGRDDAS